MPDMRELLRQKASEVEPPKAAPEGTYRWTITKHRFDKSSQKKTDFVAYTCRAIEPLGDVDPQALQEFGGIQELERELTFYITKDALIRLTEFHLNVLGLPDVTVDEQIPLTTNKTFKGTLKHTTYTRRDGTEGVRADLDQTAADD